MLARDNPEKKAEYNRRAYLKNREKRLEYARARHKATYPKNREAAKARSRAWMAAHPGYSKTRSMAYYKANRAKVLAKLRASRQGEAWRAKWKAAYWANREKALAHNKRSYQKYRAKRLDYQKTRYVRLGFIAGRKERSQEAVDWSCTNACGRETHSPTGLCQKCRMTTCKTCKKPLQMEYLGQRIHAKCLPRG